MPKSADMYKGLLMRTDNIIREIEARINSDKVFNFNDDELFLRAGKIENELKEATYAKSSETRKNTFRN